ncbi:DNA polymerase III subunit chi [Chitinibacter sp. SCUT-21]|uniref:DNA polymerase III subunit chi n=1 Tax=Chitinibacter sp. SCUT-21 TaxID=2970891 RepID=UPI0035A665EB
MTEISFYFNVRSRETALCQLAGKALAAGKRICILSGSEAATQALDRLLWEVPATGFLPHCSADSAQSTQTPIILDHRVELLQPRDVLFNWTDHVAPRFSEFGRLIEIVDTDEELRLAARQRWAAYKQLGYTPTATDMTLLTASRSD